MLQIAHERSVEARIWAFDRREEEFGCEGDPVASADRSHLAWGFYRGQDPPTMSTSAESPSVTGPRKVVVLFRATGDAPIMKQSKFKVHEIFEEIVGL